MPGSTTRPRPTAGCGNTYPGASANAGAGADGGSITSTSSGAPPSTPDHHRSKTASSLDTGSPTRSWGLGAPGCYTPPSSGSPDTCAPCACPQAPHRPPWPLRSPCTLSCRLTQCARSPPITAPSSPSTTSWPTPWQSRPTSPTRTRPGNEAPTSTSTAESASTCPRAPASPTCPRTNSMSSSPRSTTDPAKSSPGAPQPRSSTSYPQHQPHPVALPPRTRVRNQSGSDQTRQIGGWALGALTVAHDARGPLGSAAIPLPASPERDSGPETRTPMVDQVITLKPPPAPGAAPSRSQPR